MAAPRTRSKSDDRWVGRTIDRKFRLDSLIGEGAMGRVYRGEQLSLSKPVAIKMLHKHLGGDPRIAKRFNREARAASRLSHPNSLSVLDFGSAEDGTLFIAMELLEGEDLQAIIEHDAPFTPRRIANLMLQTLAAVEAAHRAGIIHRDLKPENVVVTLDRQGRDQVKVCDFGIAKITESEGRSTAITKDGYVCGTPEYMAPEQAKGEAIDARVDIYAAGVMLYQLLCGRVPFKAETALGLITKHIMERPVRPRRVEPSWGIPRSLERIALKALGKSPDERYEDAHAMALAIRAAVDELGDRADDRLGEGAHTQDLEDDAETADTAEAMPAVRPVAEQGRWFWTVALVGAVGVLGLGIGLWWKGPPAPPAVSETPAAAHGVPDRTAATTSSAPSETPEMAQAPESASPHSPEVDSPTHPPEVDSPTRRSPVVAPTPEPPGRPTPPSGEPSPRTRRARAAPEPETQATEPEAPGPAAYQAGLQHMLAGALPEAIESFGEAARAMPRNPRVQRDLGRAHMRAGSVAAGLTAYRRYLELAPEAADRALIERILSQHES